MEEETGKGSESEVDTEESEETHWGSDESEEDPESLDSDECDDVTRSLGLCHSETVMAVKKVSPGGGGHIY